MLENYNAAQLQALISVIVSIISVVSALIAIFYSHRALKISKEANSLNKLSYNRDLTNKITELREGFHADILNIRTNFPASAYASLSECNDVQKKALNSYWEVVFKEYRTCKVGIPEFEKLWDDEFRLQSFRALKWLSFRESLEELIKRKQKNPLHQNTINELRQVISESIAHYQ